MAVAVAVGAFSPPPLSSKSDEDASLWFTPPSPSLLFLSAMVQQILDHHCGFFCYLSSKGCMWVTLSLVKDVAAILPQFEWFYGVLASFFLEGVRFCSFCGGEPAI